jgi:hypothetical protein
MKKEVEPLLFNQQLNYQELCGNKIMGSRLGKDEIFKNVGWGSVASINSRPFFLNTQPKPKG